MTVKEWHATNLMPWRERVCHIRCCSLVFLFVMMVMGGSVIGQRWQVHQKNKLRSAKRVLQQQLGKIHQEEEALHYQAQSLRWQQQCQAAKILRQRVIAHNGLVAVVSALMGSSGLLVRLTKMRIESDAITLTGQSGRSGDLLQLKAQLAAQPSIRAVQVLHWQHGQFNLQVVLR